MPWPANHSSPIPSCIKNQEQRQQFVISHDLSDKMHLNEHLILRQFRIALVHPVQRLDDLVFQAKVFFV